MQISDIVVNDPTGTSVVLGDVIEVPTVVVIARYFG
jgi:hypothetical protein